VHPAKDMRIFYKECKTLAKAGYDVKLIVVIPEDKNGFSIKTEDDGGVEIVFIPCSYNSKLKRFLRAGRSAYIKALELNSDIYHFHDPEFLWFGYRLIKKGKKVIYDVHEDVPRQILGKSWIPTIFRRPFSLIFEQFENLLASKFTGIITVTDLITNRFQQINKKVIAVKNFPIVEMLPDPVSWNHKKEQICYIGDITRVRGIIEMVKSLDGLNVHLALGGKFSQTGLKEEAMFLDGWKNVIEYGFVNREQAKQILSESKIGLILLHPLVNYVDALPVKLFEFMAAGIPVVVSGLRLQKQIVEQCECGIVVNPFNTEEVQNAVRYLLQNPEIAQQMGLNGRKAVLNEFNWDNEERKLLKFYAELLS
jgi:glycosyltransferase involved in cell wall biosynthesis